MQMTTKLVPRFPGKVRRSRRWALVGVLVLAGCGGAGTLTDRLSFGRGEVRTAYDRFEAKRLDYTAITNERTEVRKLVDWYGWGAADGENGPLSRYLNTILERIVAVSPIPGLPARVVVVDRMVSPSAVAMKDGTILVPMRLLIDMNANPNRGSEDALAFLLAHELSHILYYHFQSDTFGEILEGTEALLEGAKDLLSSGYFRTSGEKLEVVYRRVGTARFLEESALTPAWTRKQENDADLLGFDLMIRAGYNPDAAYELLEFLQSYEEAAAERRQEAKATKTPEDFGGLISLAIGEALGTLGRRHATVPQRREKLNVYHERWADRVADAEDIDIRSLGWREDVSTGTIGETDTESIRRLFGNYEAAARAQAAIETGDHDEARSLIQRAHSEPTHVNAYPRIVAADYHALRGEGAEAAEHIRSALQGPGPSFHVYERMFPYLEDIEDYLTLLDEAEQRFGRFVRLMRLRATALEKAGHEDEAQSVRAACKFENALSKQRNECSEPLEVRGAW